MQLKKTRPSLAILILSLVVLGVLYLFIVNWWIYYRLDEVGLRPSDQAHSYIINQTGSDPIVYLAIGDSLTAGTGVDDYSQAYPYLIAQKLAGEDAEVLHSNSSYPGARTSDVLNNLLEDQLLNQADVITLLIGTNDIQGGVSAPEFSSNYEKIILKLLSQSDAKINLVSIPEIGNNSLFLPPFNYYFRYRVLKFNKIIHSLAVSNDLNFIDLTTPTLEYAAKSGPYYSKDNFHPSASAYENWAQIIYEHLDK